MGSGQPPIRWNDWHRILLGDVPLGFFLELFFRTAVTYMVLMGAMRWLGPRVAARVNRTQLAAVVALAAAIGIPMQTPEQGLVAAVVVALVVVLVEKFIAAQSFTSARFETAIQGEPAAMVIDGVLQWKNMRRARLTRERVFAQLRGKSLAHLGEVRRLYMESNGTFVLLHAAEEPRPGLSLIPDWDQEFAGELKPASDALVCARCGEKRPGGGKSGADPKCPNCGHGAWVPAVSGLPREESGGQEGNQQRNWGPKADQG